MHPLPAAPRRWLLATAVAAGFLLVPAAAQGSQVTSVAVANGDTVVDRAIVAEVQGTATENGRVIVDANPSNIPCAQTSDLNFNSRIESAGEYVWLSEGPISGRRLNVRIGAPGAYTLCAYYDGNSEGSTPPATLPITVRDPRASLTMSLLSAPVPGQEAPLSVTTFAEVARELWVDVNPEGLPCGLNHEANDGKNEVWGMSLLGGPTTSVVNVTMPYTAGRYHLCGYVARSYDDAAPLAVVDSGSFLVGTPPAPPAPAPVPKASCTVGPRTVTSRGTLGIRCQNATGTIEIRAKRGGRTVKVTRRLVGGVAKIRVKTLRMKRGVTKVSVFQGRAKLGGRSVRRR
jgi:hypothetical protein